MKIQTEICCGSYNDALQAEQGGALRIELNSALHMGCLLYTSPRFGCQAMAFIVKSRRFKSSSISGVKWTASGLR